MISTTTTLATNSGSSEQPSGSARSLSSAEAAFLRETLKRCSPFTFEAACQFRRTGAVECVPAIVRGIVGHYAARDLQGEAESSDALRLVDDLGLDSLTLIEIGMLAEDVFGLSVNYEELCQLRTLGEIHRFLAGKLRGDIAALADGRG
ncbi:MAG: acyl carrier protein [Opitutae bacterium]|nr:acyl carrier protein [Opitutae bacterium]